MRLLRTGKVKEVHEVSATELEFRFTDKISVFDKTIPTLVPRKGETLNRSSAHWFERVEEELDIPTHFLGTPAPDRMRVRRVEVLPVEDIRPDSTSFLVPLEVICRHYVAGSLHDRLKAGRIDPVGLGFDKGEVPAYGTPLPEPFVEFTTKLEETDRELDEEEAQDLSKLDEDEFEMLKDLVLDVDELIAEDVEARGLLHVDGKKEWAMDQDRQLMLVDTFGTADEDRWWDKRAYEERGETVELSKEAVRQHYRRTGYHAALYEARAKGIAEPDIPALPDEVVREVSDLYVRMYERITGKRA